MLRNQGNQLSPDSSGLHAFLHHNHLVGFTDRLGDRGHIKGLEADQIDQLHIHAITFKLLDCLQAMVTHA